MIRLSNTLKRLMKVGAILFGLAFIIAGVIGIRQDDTFLPTKAVIQSMERTYEAMDSNRHLGGHGCIFGRWQGLCY